MTLKTYLITMGSGTLVAWLAWGAVLLWVSPVDGLRGLLLFYSSLSLALTGTFSIIGFAIRFRRQRYQLPLQHVLLAYRQAVSYALLLIAVLVLQSQRLLTWWNLALFVFAFTLLELFFISLKHKRSRREQS